MAAGVDFGDLELFEAFDPPEESTPKPVHTRFKDDEEEEDDDDDENGVGDAELQEQLRRREATIEQLRAENILPARRAVCHLALGVWVAAGGGRGEFPRGSVFEVLPPATWLAGWRAGGKEGVSVWLQKLNPRPARDPFPASILSAHHPGPPTQIRPELL